MNFGETQPSLAGHLRPFISSLMFAAHNTLDDVANLTLLTIPDQPLNGSLDSLSFNTLVSQVNTGSSACDVTVLVITQ